MSDAAVTPPLRPAPSRMHCPFCGWQFTVANDFFDHLDVKHYDLYVYDDDF